MIYEPMPFDEAIAFISEKEPNPQAFDSRQWAMMARDVREKAFFSAKVENARFLYRAQEFIQDYLKRSIEEVVTPDGVTTTALKAGGRATFIQSMRDFQIKEGMASEESIRLANQGDIENIRSQSRLELIFDTNVKQARGYGYWLQGMNPAVLYRFPAARFIRLSDKEEKRPRHQASIGDVRLKTDNAYWADYQNAEDIGGFGTPWPPYGFNSGMDQQDVSREEAIELGLDVDSVVSPANPPPLTQGMKASTEKLEPEIKSKLLDELRAGLKSIDVNQQIKDSIAKQVAERNGRRKQYVDKGNEIAFE